MRQTHSSARKKINAMNYHARGQIQDVSKLLDRLFIQVNVVFCDYINEAGLAVINYKGFCEQRSKCGPTD